MQSTANKGFLANHYKRLILIFVLVELIHIIYFNSYETILSTVQFCPTQIAREKILANTTLSTRIFKHLQPYHYPVLCQNLFENDPYQVQYAKTLLSDTANYSFVFDHYYNITKEQCHIYRSERFNQTFHQTDTYTNQQFPLAFTILLYDNVEQFERLLRLIYRPQNFYCVHVDNQSSLHVLQAVKSIVQCFDNVILASKQEKVLYATFSRLQADLNCMEDLLKFPSWKYLLNTAGSELPLKTNSELVKILSMYRGFNDIQGQWKRRHHERTTYVWRFISSGRKNDRHRMFLRRTKQIKQPPPYNLTIVKGSAYGAFSRGFIEFVHTNPIAKELLNWSRDTYSPDEHYWSTLNYNVHLNTPGGYKARSDPTPWLARYVNWVGRPCYGRLVRGVCVFGALDLPSLFNRPELFANKFYLKFDPIVYQCMEELIVNRSKVDLPLMNAHYYRGMPFPTSS